MKSKIVSGWTDMKTLLFSLVMLCVAISSPAFAGCAQGAGQQSRLTQSQLNTVLGSRYACGQSTAVNSPGWNELHSASAGGSVTEQHEPGASDDENVGTWATSSSGGKGRVAYSYNGGVVPVYEVAFPGDVNCGTGTGAIVCTGFASQIYEFCGVGGGAPPVLSILVTTSLQTLSSCPSNP